MKDARLHLHGTAAALPVKPLLLDGSEDHLLGAEKISFRKSERREKRIPLTEDIPHLKSGVQCSGKTAGEDASGFFSAAIFERIIPGVAGALAAHAAYKNSQCGFSAAEEDSPALPHLLRLPSSAGNDFRKICASSLTAKKSQTGVGNNAGAAVILTAHGNSRAGVKSRNKRAGLI
jgi:hypothetical protein